MKLVREIQDYCVLFSILFYAILFYSMCSSLVHGFGAALLELFATVSMGSTELILRILSKQSWV